MMSISWMFYCSTGSTGSNGSDITLGLCGEDGAIYPELDFDPSDQVTVSEVPVPTAFWLLGSALLVAARKTRKSKLSC
ncbi:MAG: hypothetical protein ACJAZ0_002420 [Halioglobus sp.]|jgi:hypothetical protein